MSDEIQNPAMATNSDKPPKATFTFSGYETDEVLVMLEDCRAVVSTLEYLFSETAGRDNYTQGVYIILDRLNKSLESIEEAAQATVYHPFHAGYMKGMKEAADEYNRGFQEGLKAARRKGNA